ncbi:hypothetical protein LY78DRAFT_141247 [Colletotrichum sublineola]|nr:hypothetical protein LY78DRAFT_141247 [Colletotrichum sublineola]
MDQTFLVRHPDSDFACIYLFSEKGSLADNLVEETEEPGPEAGRSLICLFCLIISVWSLSIWLDQESLGLIKFMLPSLPWKYPQSPNSLLLNSNRISLAPDSSVQWHG